MPLSRVLQLLVSHHRTTIKPAPPCSPRAANRRRDADDYSTDVLSRELNAFVREADADNKPFFAWVSPYPPHHVRKPAAWAHPAPPEGGQRPRCPQALWTHGR